MVKKLTIYSLFFLWMCAAYAQIHTNMHFSHLTVEDKLSHNAVHAIFQDYKGFMWFGTEDGLNRYDGYAFKVYRLNPMDSTSLSDIFINDIFEDSDSQLWIGTNSGGVNLYNRKLDNFTHFKHKNTDPKSISSNNIRCIYQDSKGTIWIGTNGGGLCRYNPAQNNFEVYRNIPDNPNSLPHNDVRRIYEDTKQRMWICTNNGGLALMNRKKGTFQVFNSDENQPQSISDDEVTGVMELSNGNIWVSTRNGLNKFDLKTTRFQRFYADLANPNTIPDNNVTRMLRDSVGNLWIGTANGLVIWDKASGKFIRQFHRPNDPKSLSQNFILSIYEDRTGIIWIGTTEGGINIYDRRARKFEHITAQGNTRNALSSNSIRSFYADSKGVLWIGTLGEGLDAYNIDNKQFTHYKQSPGTKNSLSNNKISAIMRDSKERLWVGTWEGGLNLMEFKGEKYTVKNFQSAANIPGFMQSTSIQCLLQDRTDRIWIGTENGIHLYNEEKANFEVFQYEPSNPNSLSANTVQSKAFIEDFEGNFWVGTWDGLNFVKKVISPNGKLKLNVTRIYHNATDDNTLSDNRIISLCLTDKNTLWCGTFGRGLNQIKFKESAKGVEIISVKRYDEKDGLPNNVIYAIESDKQGRLWMSTNNGLSCFDPKTGVFKNYDTSDGLQSNIFFWGASTKLPNGDLVFGGINGFNIFNPEEVKDNPYAPTVVITDFKIFNQLVSIGPKSPLIADVSETRTIELKHSDNMITFEFAALHFSNPEQNKYKYRLVNFDRKLIETTADRRYATYTNLDPGRYRFEVFASNCDEVWNSEGVSIDVIVLPPIWQTWWFRLISVIAFLGLAYLAYWLRLNAILKQKKQLEHLVSIRTQEVEKQKADLENANIELEKLSIVASETDNAVVIMDGSGRFEWINKAYQKLFGYSLQQMRDMNIDHIYIENMPLEIKHLIEQVFEHKIPIHYEFETKDNNEQRLWLQSTLTPVLNAEGALVKLVAIDSDITVIKSAEEEITAQRDALEAQNIRIENQNNQIKGSIRYALTIQQAILPQNEFMQRWFKSFTLYLPKDIVSGDFYWMSRVDDTLRNETIIFVAVIDCTGHGVPGAFMSLIGNRLLNEIVNERGIYRTDKILKALNEGIVSALRQDYTNNDDGMDVCLVALRYRGDNEVNVEFSGAKRNLFYTENDSNQISIAEGSRKSIGGSKAIRTKLEFTSNNFNLAQGNMLYLSTDGFVDQNGPDRKRFGTEKLLKLLSAIHLRPLDEQQIAIEIALTQHMKNDEQRDDITIVGIRL